MKVSYIRHCIHPCKICEENDEKAEDTAREMERNRANYEARCATYMARFHERFGRRG